MLTINELVIIRYYYYLIIRPTRNTFCGTWYRPYSWVTVLFLDPNFLYDVGTLANSVINLGYIAYVSMRMREPGSLPVWNLTSLSCSLDPNFLHDAGIPANSRTLKAEIGIFMFAWIFSFFWPKMAVLGQIGEGWCDVDPNKLAVTFGGCYTSVPLLAKINREMRPREWGQTDRQKDRETDGRTDRRNCYS